MEEVKGGSAGSSGFGTGEEGKILPLLVLCFLTADAFREGRAGRARGQAPMVGAEAGRRGKLWEALSAQLLFRSAVARLRGRGSGARACGRARVHARCPPRLSARGSGNCSTGLHAVPLAHSLAVRLQLGWGRSCIAVRGAVVGRPTRAARRLARARIKARDEEAASVRLRQMRDAARLVHHWAFEWPSACDRVRRPDQVLQLERARAARRARSQKSRTHHRQPISPSRLARPTAPLCPAIATTNPRFHSCTVPSASPSSPAP